MKEPNWCRFGIGICVLVSILVSPTSKRFGTGTGPDSCPGMVASLAAEPLMDSILIYASWKLRLRIKIKNEVNGPISPYSTTIEGGKVHVVFIYSIGYT